MNPMAANPPITNPPVATPFFFYMLAAIMIIGGILVITRKNAIHSAMALITTLLAQAALYLMLYAPFVAGVQIILYAGGIMVLFLFVIMLINLERNMKERQFNKQWLVGIAAAAALGGLFIAVYTTSTGGKALFPEGHVTYNDGGNTQAVAALLFDRGAGQYMFAFEIASLLLLVAIIGAVVMAKKRI
jgi:NADH-quinone oxidoreductase subunit J